MASTVHLALFSLLLFSTGQCYGLTVQECNNWFVDDAVSVESQDELCIALERHAVCLLRTVNPEITPGIEAAVKKSYDDAVSKYGVDCNIDMDQVMQSVRDNTAPPSGPGGKGGNSTGPTKAIMKCVKDSATEISVLANQNKDNICPHIKDMMKCMVRASSPIEDLADLSPVKLQQAQAQLDNSYNQVGFHCDFTIVEIIQELNNAGSSIKPSHVLWILVSLVSVLLGHLFYVDSFA